MKTKALLGALLVVAPLLAIATPAEAAGPWTAYSSCSRSALVAADGLPTPLSCTVPSSCPLSATNGCNFRFRATITILAGIGTAEVTGGPTCTVLATGSCTTAWDYSFGWCGGCGSSASWLCREFSDLLSLEHTVAVSATLYCYEERQIV